MRIVEIGEIATQGVTEPVFCRAEDGMEYLVKGANAGRRSLIAEWMANRIGKLLNLPIPNFSLLEIDPSLVKYSLDRKKVEHLGKGVLFGSNRVPNVVEFRQSDLPFVSQELQARVLAFDWWIANSDRILVNGNGNPNLLWVEKNRTLVVIDHNLAFDMGGMSDFWAHHPFRAAASFWSDSFYGGMAEEFRRAYSCLSEIWRELPLDWLESETEISLAMLQSLLWRFESDAGKFWRPK